MYTKWYEFVFAAVLSTALLSSSFARAEEAGEPVNKITPAEKNTQKDKEFLKKIAKEKKNKNGVAVPSASAEKTIPSETAIIYKKADATPIQPSSNQ